MANLLEESMRLLNTNPNTVYALSYNSVLNAWCVVKLIKTSSDSNTFRGEFKMIPFSNNHLDAQSAIRDAVILKLHGDRTSAPESLQLPAPSQQASALPPLRTQTS